MMSDFILSDWEREFILTQPVARLATVDGLGQPHVIPIVYVFDQMRFFTPIDGKKKRTTEARQLRRVRNILQNPRVSLIIDIYDADWTQLAWVQVHGTAQLIYAGLLTKKLSVCCAANTTSIRVCRLENGRSLPLTRIA